MLCAYLKLPIVLHEQQLAAGGHEAVDGQSHGWLDGWTLSIDLVRVGLCVLLGGCMMDERVVCV